MVDRIVVMRDGVVEQIGAPLSSTTGRRCLLSLALSDPCQLNLLKRVS